MECQFKNIGNDIFVCINCNRRVGPFPGLDAKNVHFPCKSINPIRLPPELESKLAKEIKTKEDTMKKGGPGTELHNLLDKLGFKLDPDNMSCGCQSMILKMNDWGVKGCQKENNRKEILKHLEEQKHLTKMRDKIKAGILAIKEGLPLSVEGLLDEAIKKADQRG